MPATFETLGQINSSLHIYQMELGHDLSVSLMTNGTRTSFNFFVQCFNAVAFRSSTSSRLWLAQSPVLLDLTLRVFTTEDKTMNDSNNINNSKPTHLVNHIRITVIVHFLRLGRTWG